MRILVVRVGAMGDVLHALPAVAGLREARPDWKVDWVVDPRWDSLLMDAEGRGPIVHRIHPAETRLWSKAPVSLTTLRSIAELRRALRKERYDLVVDMQGTLRSAVIGRMARGKDFAGFSDPREGLAAGFYSRKLERRGKHVVDQGAALLGEACGFALRPEPVILPHATAADLWAEELVGGRSICLLAPGAGWDAKRWPAEKFGLLANELRKMGMDVIINSSHKDDPLAAAVVRASGGSARVEVCDVAGLVALVRRSTVVVGGDSGPMHLAAALGVPVVALFGPTDPERNGPWGPGKQMVLRDPASVTSYKRTAKDLGLARLPVEVVVGAVHGLI